MSKFIDIDLFSNIDSNGRVIEYSNADAFKNALLFFLTCKRGDILEDPTTGGILNERIFKSMRTVNLENIAFSIESSIINGFAPTFEINDIIITPDYDNKILEIEIRFVNPITAIPDTLTVYTKDPTDLKSFNYVDVDYVEENLYNFILTQYPTYKGERLVYNADKGCFTWAKWCFVNLTAADAYFGQILQLINQT